MKKKRIFSPTRLIVAAAILAVVGVGYWFWFGQSEPETDATKLPAKLVGTAQRRDIETKLLLTGEVSPAFSVDVKSEISGRVEKVHVTTGQFVQKGDQLVTIDDNDLLTEKRSALTNIEGAKLDVEKKQGNYDRAKALFDEKLISKEVYENLHSDLLISKNSLTKSESSLQSVEDKLSKTRILAPADGTVLAINVNEGQVVVGATSVNAGVILMQFADLNRLNIDTHVNQMDVGKIKVGDILRVRMQGEDSRPLKARVEFIAPVATVKNNIKGFAVESQIEDLDERLRPGMSVSMELAMASSKATVSVPIGAVFTEDDHKYVYVRRGESTERRLVEIGLTNFSFAEIKSGLDEGEEVLLVAPRNTPKKS